MLAVIGAFITGALTYAFTGSLIFALIMGGLALITNLYAPRPKTMQMKPASLSDFSVSTANEGQPVPIVYGRVKIPGNIIYYGNLRAEPVYQKIKIGKKGGGSKSQKVLTGYNYYIDLWQAICEGKVVLEKAFLDGDENKSISSSYFIWNDGTMNTYPTISDNPDLQYTSKLKGVAHIFYKNFYVGFNRTYVPPIDFWVRRVLETNLPYQDISIGNEYVGNNPAAVILDLLIKSNISLADVNMDSFIQASNYFNSEKIGINLVISSTQPALEIIKDICKQVNAFLDYDEQGKITLRIFRQTDASIATIEDDFIKIQINKPSWLTVPNEFKANFVENGTVRTVLLENPAAKLLTNKSNPQFYDLTMFSHRQVVFKVLTQIMKRESFPRVVINTTLPLRYAYLKVGDIVRIKHTDTGLDGEFRIVQITEPKLDSNEIEVTLIQHTDAIFDTQYLPSEGTLWRDPQYSLVPFTKIKIIELDYNPITKDSLAILILVSKERGYETAFDVYISQTGTDFQYLGRSSIFANYGTLAQPYPNTTYDIDDEVGIIYTPYKHFEQFSDIDRTSLFTTDRIVVVNNEIMTFQQYQPHGTNSYRLTGIIRDLMWSGKASHSTGSPVFVCNIHDNIFIVPFTTTFYLKIVPVFMDHSLPLNAVSTITFTPSLRAQKPLDIQAIYWQRSGTTVYIDIFPITKIYNTGAGKQNADSYTDVYPFEYEGQVIYKIDDGPEQVSSSCHITINNANAFTFTARLRWNGHLSAPYSINIPAAS